MKSGEVDFHTREEKHQDNGRVNEYQMWILSLEMSFNPEPGIHQL